MQRGKVARRERAVFGAGQDAPARLVDDVVGAVLVAGDEALGQPGDGGDHDPVAKAADGVRGEHDAGGPGADHGLDDDGDPALASSPRAVRYAATESASPEATTRRTAAGTWERFTSSTLRNCPACEWASPSSCVAEERTA